MTEAEGLPLVVRTTPANVNDGVPALELVDAIPPIQGMEGRPRRRPMALLGDRAYGSKKNVRGTTARRIISLLAEPGEPHGSGLGTMRYVVERTLAWFNSFRRLRLCYEKKGSHFQALHELAASLICAKRIERLGLGI